MANDWLEGVTRYDSGNGGSLVGGPPRWVWHTYEADPNRLSALNGAKYLVQCGNDVHFTFNPVSGQIVQILPGSTSGRGLKNAAGGVETNRMGSACIQVEVIAFAAHPWTSYLTPAGKAGLAKLIQFARAHGIPDTWPAGAPPVFPPGNGNRSATIWATKAGHYGHSQVPENDHGDPGALDLRVLFPPTPVTPSKPAPVPVHIPQGADMVILATPNNGSFLLTSLGRTPLEAGLASRLSAAGFPTVHLGAQDTTDLTATNQVIVTNYLTAEKAAMQA